jgi:hypothetical protein
LIGVVPGHEKPAACGRGDCRIRLIPLGVRVVHLCVGCDRLPKVVGGRHDPILVACTVSVAGLPSLPAARRTARQVPVRCTRLRAPAAYARDHAAEVGADPAALRIERLDKLSAAGTLNRIRSGWLGLRRHGLDCSAPQCRKSARVRCHRRAGAPLLRELSAHLRLQPRRAWDDGRWTGLNSRMAGRICAPSTRIGPAPAL